MHETTELQLRLSAITWKAPGINTYEFRLPSGGELPAFAAGAHIDLYLPNGIVRSYSLANAQSERDRYVVGVQKDRSSRGGSRCLHEDVHVGDIIKVVGPRNNFPLDEGAENTLLIAGGIGVTPILCMARRLAEQGKRWQMYYSARTRAEAAFLTELAELAALPGGTLHLNFDQEPGGRMLDLAAIVAAAAGSHVYCCGPLPMLAAFELACEKIPASHVHLEYFTAKEAPVTSGGFTVVLAKSGKELFVAEGKTILDAVLDAGIDMSYSCMEGVCGSCEVAVLEGTPDHRDLVLTKSEQEASKTMMICCSGSKSQRLVLDI